MSKYNAYKPHLMSDGVETWTRHEFDQTKVPTEDDWKKFRHAFSDPHLHPHGRIEIMQARLDSLENITPTIQLHVDAIRKIHADFLAAKPITLESLDALEKQNDHWLKIQLIRDTIPAARAGVKHATEQANRRKGKSKLTATEKKQIIREYAAAVSAYGMIKSLARKFDVSEDTISRTIHASDTKQD